MAQPSTTSQEAEVKAPATDEIVDQATLDKALEETAPKAEVKAQVDEPKPVVEEPYKQRYSALRSDYDKLSKELKDMKAQAKSAEVKAKLSEMDYDQKIEYLADEQAKRDQLQEELQSNLQRQAEQETVQADNSVLEDFISSDKELQLLGPEVQRMFKAIASSNEFVDPALAGGQEVKWKEVKLDDIKTHFFKPLLDKLSGTKITVKERKVRSESSSVADDTLTPERISKMSAKEYEKNRDKILRASGVNI